MRAPYKVIVWGSGRIGKICIWEILQAPAFELVGVRAYDENKHGLDAGELLGIASVGVQVSTNVDALLGTVCDCIVYTARDNGTYDTDEEILMILAAGRSVVTPLPYQNAHLFREPAFIGKLKAACARGGSVFHAGGVDPDLVSARLALGLTGACADVRSIRLQEMWDCSLAEPRPLKFIGFGMSPELAQNNVATQRIPNNFAQAIVHTAAHILGVTYDRIEESHDYVATESDILLPFHIPSGTVGRITHRLQGFVDAIGEAPFFTMEYNWFIGATMLPQGILPGQYHVVTIEGRPSIKMALDFRVSQSNERCYRIGNMEVEPSYVATAVPCLQAIPHVCAAAPGILPSFGPALHWMRDLRESVPRSRTV